MHKYLVEQGWVKDYPGKASRMASYLAFFFIPPCAFMAYVEWLLTDSSATVRAVAVVGCLALLAGLISSVFVGYPGYVTTISAIILLAGAKGLKAGERQAR